MKSSYSVRKKNNMFKHKKYVSTIYAKFQIKKILEFIKHEHASTYFLNCFFCDKKIIIKCHDCKKGFCDTCYRKHNVIKFHHLANIQLRLLQ